MTKQTPTPDADVLAGAATPTAADTAATEEARSSIVALTEAERAEEAQQEAVDRLNELAETLTQKEWLLVCRALNVTRDQLQADSGLKLLALSWVQQKREHGGASWDRLLELTDNQLLELHGIHVTAAATDDGDGDVIATGDPKLPSDE